MQHTLYSSFFPLLGAFQSSEVVVRPFLLLPTAFRPLFSVVEGRLRPPVMPPRSGEKTNANSQSVPLESTKLSLFKRSRVCLEMVRFLSDTHICRH